MPLVSLAAQVFLVRQWAHSGPPFPWHPIYGWYLAFGTTPPLAATVGWPATRSSRRTVALATAASAAFFVWLIVYLEINQWVTGVPIFPPDG